MKQTEGGFYFSALQAPVLFVLRAVYMGGGTRRLSFKRDFLWDLNGIISKRMKWKTQTQLLTKFHLSTEMMKMLSKDEVKEEAARLNNEWLALFPPPTQ